MPQPVGQAVPNAWGFHDMLVNVNEWAGGWYGRYPGGSSTDPTGPAAGNSRLHRGCGWFGYARICRVPARAYERMSWLDWGLGFSLAKTGTAEQDE